MSHVFAPLEFEHALPVADGATSIVDLCRAVVYRELTDLREDWLGLEARASATLFQSHAWCSAWAQAGRDANCPEDPRIVTVWSAGRLVLLWPLAVRRLGPFRVLQGFAHPATQYCDALIEEGPHQGRWLELAWDSIRSMRGIDAVRITGIRADSAVAPLLGTRRHAHVTRTDAAPFTDFRASAGGVRRRSGRTRNALLRHLRHLSDHGEVAFEVIADGQERVAAMREMLDLKHAWLVRTAQVSAGYMHPANAAFLKALASQDDFFMARLKVGTRTAAVEGGVLREGRYWSLVQSYDGRFAPHGPGRLVFWHILERAAALRIEVFDFLAPATRHKTEWANGAMPVHDVVVPLRLPGWLVLAYVRRVRPLLKRCAAPLSRCIRRPDPVTPASD